MICPQCGTRQAAGVSRCPRCGVELVEEETVERDEAEWVKDVVILETNDESQLLVARALLEAEGIPSFAQNEEGQQLLAAGPMRLRVRPTDEKAARELLAHLQSGAAGEE